MFHNSVSSQEENLSFSSNILFYSDLNLILNAKKNATILNPISEPTFSVVEFVVSRCLYVKVCIESVDGQLLLLLRKTEVWISAPNLLVW